MKTGANTYDEVHMDFKSGARTGETRPIDLSQRQGAESEAN